MLFLFISFLLFILRFVVASTASALINGSVLSLSHRNDRVMVENTHCGEWCILGGKTSETRLERKREGDLGILTGRVGGYLRRGNVKFDIQSNI
ncbi:hypothetical protein EV426DRAFT_628152 [Tirmania nivea]|nr:hypothetical protein EV426DRAFT_628152 [Tirmania nivea]